MENDECKCECKKHNICEIDYIWNPAICSCKNGKYLASIIDNIDNTVVTYDEIIEETKTVTTNFHKKAIICEKKLYILLAFLFITIALLITVSNYCYLIKYEPKKTFITILRRKWQINKSIINIDSIDKLKEIGIKNRTYYYFDDITKTEDVNLDNRLVDEKSYENTLAYNISYKTFD